MYLVDKYKAKNEGIFTNHYSFFFKQYSRVLWSILKLLGIEHRDCYYNDIVAEFIIVAKVDFFSIRIPWVLKDIHFKII